jgi:pectate lyase
LTVNVPPTISTQPQSQIVTVSNVATFTVIAAGDAPLSYQWHFNSAPISNATNATYAISSALTNNAGNYFVTVTNNFGAVTSSIVTLTVNPASGAPDFSMIGFATLSGFSSNGTFQAGGTTGGNAGPIVIVSNVTWLVNYAEKSNMALRILIVSNIDCSTLANHHGGFPAGYPTGEILVSSNKTIYSTNGATISRGTLRIGKASNGKDNIIIRNLKFRDLWVFDPSGNYDSYGWDYIGLEGGSHHVWVDHCDFEQVYDGMIDVTHASDYVTVSWNVFRTQKKCSLIGHSDNNASEDTGHFNVTFHHNYYVDVDERMPRMRFGNAHVFNLYCENLGGNGIQSTADAATLVENSYFYQPKSGTLPTREENGGPTGIIKVVNSTIVNLPSVNVQFRQFGETNFLFNAPFVGAVPPYPYTLDPTANVPSIVTNWSGVNKVTILP